MKYRFLEPDSNNKIGDVIEVENPNKYLQSLIDAKKVEKVDGREKEEKEVKSKKK